MPISVCPVFFCVNLLLTTPLQLCRRPGKEANVGCQVCVPTKLIVANFDNPPAKSVSTALSKCPAKSYIIISVIPNPPIISTFAITDLTLFQPHLFLFSLESEPKFDLSLRSERPPTSLTQSEHHQNSFGNHGGQATFKIPIKQFINHYLLFTPWGK
jgi:hypothetical protein